MSGVGTPTVINALSFSADGNTLAAAKDFGRVVIWNVPEKKFLRALDTGQGIVNAVAISPDGKTVATGGKGDQLTVKIWDVRTGYILKELKNSEAPTSLDYDGTGQSLVIVDNVGVLRVLNSSSWEPTLTLNNIRASTLSQDRKSLVTVDEKELATWSFSSWAKIQSSPVSKNAPLLLAAHSGKDRLGLYQRKSMRIVRGSTGDVILERADFFPKNFTWRPTFAQFNSDGTFLYASMDGCLWLWNIAKNQACSTSQMYSGTGTLSDDGRWLAGAKDDSILARERTDGVWLWETKRLAASCAVD